MSSSFLSSPYYQSGSKLSNNVKKLIGLPMLFSSLFLAIMYLVNHSTCMNAKKTEDYDNSYTTTGLRYLAYTVIVLAAIIAVVELLPQMMDGFK